VPGIGTVPPVLAGETSAGTELAVVDTTVEDHETLARAAREADMDVVNVSSAAEMEAALAERSNLAAVHVFSHGSVGTVQIGTDTLQRGTFDQYSGLTGALDSSLAADGGLTGNTSQDRGREREANVGDVSSPVPNDAVPGQFSNTPSLTGGCEEEESEFRIDNSRGPPARRHT
jgi:hypothetical protein